MITTILSTGSIADLAAELQAAGLPISDLTEANRRFFRFDDDAGLIGYGGVEGTGSDRLLRSLIVTPGRQRNGLGGTLLGALESAAADDGTSVLYLLTMTAERFFQRYGYRIVDRAEAPSAISSSTEFRSLCPASATFLYKRII